MGHYRRTGRQELLFWEEQLLSPRITVATIGKIIDLGIKDPNATGPAMPPAAAETLLTHLCDASYYDMIYTGDLGSIGKKLLLELLREKGVDIAGNYEDCGLMFYNREQDTHVGASGCGCSAIVFTSVIYKLLVQKSLSKVLFIGTGSLHSPTSYLHLQKESIPAIAHAVAIEI